MYSFLYTEVLLRWEKEFRGREFDIRDKQFKAFRKDNNVELIATDSIDDVEIATIERSAVFEAKPMSLFVYHKCENSRAKSPFKHLRDAVGHGHIRQIKIDAANYFSFQNVYKGRTRMSGQIKAARLKDFIHALHETVK